MINTDVVIITSSHYFLGTQGKKERASIWIDRLWTMSFNFLMEWNSRKKGHNEKLGKRPFEDKFWRALEDVAKNHKQMVVVAILFQKWVKNMFGQCKIACCFSPVSKEREVRKEILRSNRNGGTMRALTRPAVCKKGMLEEVEKSCLCKKARNYRARM